MAMATMSISTQSRVLEVDHRHGGDVVHGVGGEEEQRPASADAGAAHEAIAFAGFEPDSSAQHGAGDARR